MAREIVLSLAVSPAGRPCIDMVVGESRYILLTTKLDRLAESLIRQLWAGDWMPGAIPTDACSGIALNRRASLARQDLVWESHPGAIGVYVPEDRYDELVSALGENNL